LDPPPLSLPTERNDEQTKSSETYLHATPDPMISTSTAPSITYTHESLDQTIPKRNYKLIPSSSQQIYRTVPVTETNENFNDKFTQLTLSQLELLENYDPIVSARIGVPFIPVQMLARPRDAQQTAKRSIQQIENDYPKFHFHEIFNCFYFVFL
jgi:hypothetical protein